MMTGSGAALNSSYIYWSGPGAVSFDPTTGVFVNSFYAPGPLYNMAAAIEF